MMPYSVIRSVPCKSAFYRIDSRAKSTDLKVSRFIFVHPRFFNIDVTVVEKRKNL